MTDKDIEENKRREDLQDRQRKQDLHEKHDASMFREYQEYLKKAYDDQAKYKEIFNIKEDSFAIPHPSNISKQDFKENYMAYKDYKTGYPNLGQQEEDRLKFNEGFKPGVVKAGDPDTVEADKNKRHKLSR